MVRETCDLGDGDIDLFAIGGRTPEQAALAPALSHALLPKALSFPIRIESIDDARLLAGYESLAATFQVHEDWRGAEIIVRTLLVRAARRVMIQPAGGPRVT